MAHSFNQTGDIVRQQLQFQLAVVIAVLACSSPLPTLALSSDSDKPMEIVANEAEHDNNKRITIYRGDVEVTQGTLFISGHTLTVHYTDNQELDHAVMQGDRAYYKQLPDNSKVYDKAWANQMEYYPDKGMVILIDNGKVVQEDLRFTGDRIEYDTINSRVIAKTVKQQRNQSTDDGQTTKEDDRVRVIISPQKDDSQNDDTSDTN